MGMKVDKEKFDALLGRLITALPQEGKTIKGTAGNTKPMDYCPTPSKRSN